MSSTRIERIVDELIQLSAETIDSCGECDIGAEGSEREQELLDKLHTFFTGLVAEYRRKEGVDGESSN
jgi:hypothetical protein